MGLRDSKPMIDRMYRSALPGQFLREYWKNAVQARATKIFIEPFWPLVTLRKVWKWSIVDNGKGMNRDQLLDLPNNLSASGSSIGNNTNFGLGAKIAALPFSPFGILIISRVKGGRPCMVRLGQLPSGLEYGLQEMVEIDEEGAQTTALSIKPPAEYEAYLNKKVGKNGSGTMIVLLGSADEEDTWLTKDKGDAGEYVGIRDPQRTLNNRIFRVPPGVETKIFEFAFGDKFHELKPRDEWPTGPAGMYRTLKGKKHFLDVNSTKKGTMETPNADIHWWIHNTKGIKDDEAEHPSAASVGVLHDDEVYNYYALPDMGCQNVMNTFGLYFYSAMKKVTILVEPKLYDVRGRELFAPNDVRSEVLHLASKRPDDLSFPMSDFGSKFRVSPPKAIADLIDSERPKLDEHLGKRLDQMLEKYQDLLKYSRKLSVVVPAKLGEGHVVDPLKYREPGDGGGPSWNDPKPSKPGTKVVVRPYPRPEVHWISELLKLNIDKADMKVNGVIQAARFMQDPEPEKSILFMSMDHFRFFHHYSRACDHFRIDPEIHGKPTRDQQEVLDKLCELASFHVVLKIVDTLANFQKGGKVSEQQIRAMLSPESLSFALAGFDFFDQLVRSLEKRLGSLKNQTSEKGLPEYEVPQEGQA